MIVGVYGVVCVQVLFEFVVDIKDIVELVDCFVGGVGGGVIDVDQIVFGCDKFVYC